MAQAQIQDNIDQIGNYIHEYTFLSYILVKYKGNLNGTLEDIAPLEEAIINNSELKKKYELFDNPVEILLKKGANPNFVRKNKDSFLILVIKQAKQKPFEETKSNLNLLLDYGADPFIVHTDQTWSEWRRQLVEKQLEVEQARRRQLGADQVEVQRGQLPPIPDEIFPNFNKYENVLTFFLTNNVNTDNSFGPFEKKILDIFLSRKKDYINIIPITNKQHINRVKHRAKSLGYDSAPIHNRRLLDYVITGLFASDSDGYIESYSKSRQPPLIKYSEEIIRFLLEYKPELNDVFAESGKMISEQDGIRFVYPPLYLGIIDTDTDTQPSRPDFHGNSSFGWFIYYTYYFLQNLQIAQRDNRFEFVYPTVAHDAVRNFLCEHDPGIGDIFLNIFKLFLENNADPNTLIYYSNNDAEYPYKEVYSWTVLDAFLTLQAYCIKINYIVKKYPDAEILPLILGAHVFQLQPGGWIGRNFSAVGRVGVAQFKTDDKFLKRIQDFIDLLFKHNVDVNFRKKRGITTLMNNFLTVNQIKHLLDNGADPTLKDTFGRTALHFVAATGWDRFADHRTASSHSAMILCAMGSGSVLKILLEYEGVDPNLKDNFGRTALHYAIFPEAAEILLEAGADPSLTDISGNTVLDYDYFDELYPDRTRRSPYINSEIERKKNIIRQEIENRKQKKANYTKRVLQQGRDENRLSSDVIGQITEYSTGYQPTNGGKKYKLKKSRKKNKKK